jgi:acyl carrier protein
VDASQGRPLTRQQVLDEVRDAVAQLGLGPADVDLDAHLVDDLDLDSLDWVDLAMKLEERLDVPLREQRFAALRTLRDVVEQLETGLAGRGAA